MKQVTLGNSNEKVSALCLGAMLFGSRHSDKESFALLDQFVEAGGNFIDTANMYACWMEGCQGGESESCLGRWMKARGNRGLVFLSTKVGQPYPGTQRGTGTAQVISECDKSLKRLQTDRIDLYYSHIDDRLTPMHETLEAFSRLVQAGKVRHIGASNFTAWRLEEARRTSFNNNFPDYCCVQQLHTYLKPVSGASLADDYGMAVANDDLLDYCLSRPFPIVAYSPVLQGFYAKPGAEIPPRFRTLECGERLALLKKIAEAHSATTNQVILAWMTQKKPLTIPLSGASSPAQLAENLKALSIVLNNEEIALLNNVPPDSKIPLKTAAADAAAVFFHNMIPQKNLVA